MAIWSEARGKRVILLAALVAAPVCYVLGILRPRALEGTHRPSVDFYLYFYPNVIHAVHSLREGFGLFWNPYQNCGQPFFANSLSALLYPPNYLFFVLERETALMVSTMFHMSLGGLGVWLLLRELRLAPAARFGGAIAFQICTTALHLSAWSPMHIGPYVWMPWGLFAAERILRNPTPRNGVLLAGVLAFQLLPGFPLPLVFTGQLIVLRFLFGLVTREVASPRRWLVPLALGFVGAPLLVAVQYIPSMQVAMESVRASGIDDKDVLEAAWRLNRPGLAIAALIGASFVVRPRHGVGVFYLVIAFVFGLMSLGDRTPLFDLYTALPLGDLFVRRPGRFLWVTSFAISVAVGIAIDALAQRERPPRAVRHALLPGIMLLAAIAVGLTPTWHPVPYEWIGAIITIALAVWSISRFPGHRNAVWAIGVVVGIAGLHAQRAPVINARAGPLYTGSEEALSVLRERMTSQDRVLIDAGPVDFPLGHKLATIYQIPGVRDYEPQTTQRFAEYTVHLNRGTPMRRLNHFLNASRLSSLHSRGLMNLAATRYLIVPARARGEARDPNWVELVHDDRIAIYQNRMARPRAAYVPMLKVWPRDRILTRLTDRRHRPAQMALIEQEPISGNLGERGGRGKVRFVEDRGERVVLEVEATRPGFVTLADQHFPGWIAKVNGQPKEILRANYAFRAVEVPAGRSEIVFEYRLTPIYAGAAISLVAALLLFEVWRREGQGDGT